MSADATGTGHLDATVVADLAEGLLAPADAAAAEGHLAACAACRDVHDQLDRVVSLLRDARESGPVPADVAARLDAALAAESVRTRTPSAARAERPVSELPARGLRRLPQLRWPGPGLAAAAAAAGVIALGSWVAINADSPPGADGSVAAESAPLSEPGDMTLRDPEDAGGATPAARPESFSALDGLSLQRAVRRLADRDLAPTRGVEATELSPLPGQAAPPGCGADLASALGRQLLGVRAAGGARGEFLVVTRGVEPGTAEGYVVAACDAGPTAASLRATVPVPPPSTP